MKNILTLCILLATGIAFGQDEPPKNWFTLDPNEDKVQGVSADKVYKTLLKNKKSRTVIVAVIDSGVDIEHEDLKGKIWVNEDEIPGNGKDDDKNGYVDDVYGWNFIGGKDGNNVDADTYELTREYARLKPTYEGLTAAPEGKQDEYGYWLEVERKFKNRSSKAIRTYELYKNLYDQTVTSNDVLTDNIGQDSIRSGDLAKIQGEAPELKQAVGTANMLFMQVGDKVSLVEIIAELEGAIEYYEVQVQYGYNPDFDSRKIVGDNWDDPYEVGYGNTDVEGPDAFHGTHVAGIIAADRNNDLGIRGIAENVKIMAIRAVPNGDERDKDVANAIRYAVDNGAHIINMSFGKSFTYRKNLVDEAIKYAQEKGVVCIHAAGNDGEDLDVETNFPTPMIAPDTRATNWIEVGASSWGTDENFVAGFSNYGKTTVDLFAPGVAIYSTTPNNEYSNAQGTSMAAPATSGVAAIIMSYFPELTADEVVMVLKQSTRRFDNLAVTTPGSDAKVNFQELSITGGLVNAFEAVKLATEMTAGKKKGKR